MPNLSHIDVHCANCGANLQSNIAELDRDTPDTLRVHPCEICLERAGLELVATVDTTVSEVVLVIHITELNLAALKRLLPILGCSSYLPAKPGDTLRLNFDRDSVTLHKPE